MLLKFCERQTYPSKDIKLSWNMENTHLSFSFSLWNSIDLFDVLSSVIRAKHHKSSLTWYSPTSTLGQVRNTFLCRRQTASTSRNEVICPCRAGRSNLADVSLVAVVVVVDKFDRARNLRWKKTNNSAASSNTSPFISLYWFPPIFIP